MGTHTNRIDAKGRVSIPAPFRAALRGLAEDGNSALVLRASHKHACIECWPAKYFAELAPPLESMAVWDDDHDDLAMALYPDALPFEPDKEGRIPLPEDLVHYAGLGETAVFMGLGKIFHIWEPAAAERARAEARARAREKRLTLRPNPAPAADQVPA